MQCHKIPYNIIRISKNDGYRTIGYVYTQCKNGSLRNRDKSEQNMHNW